MHVQLQLGGLSTSKPAVVNTPSHTHTHTLQSAVLSAKHFQVEPHQPGANLILGLEPNHHLMDHGKLTKSTPN